MPARLGFLPRLSHPVHAGLSDAVQHSGPIPAEETVLAVSLEAQDLHVMPSSDPYPIFTFWLHAHFRYCSGRWLREKLI